MGEEHDARESQVGGVDMDVPVTQPGAARAVYLEHFVMVFQSTDMLRFTFPSSRAGGGMYGGVR